MHNKLSRRILFLITGLGYGGAEKQVLLLTKALKGKGHSVTIVSMITPSSLVDQFWSAGITVHSLDMERKKPSLRALFKLRRIIRDFHPDVVHSHMVHANLMARIVRMIIPFPLLVCTAHSINEGGRWHEIAYRVTDPLCDITTNVSLTAVKRYIEIKAVPTKKIVYVPNGLELPKNNSADTRIVSHESHKETGFTWLAVGRFVPAKDYANMIYAFQIVHNEIPTTRLQIAGDGPLRDQIAVLVASLGLTRVVSFLGLRSDVSELMRSADGFVMSSMWEGLPMVLLEAAAARLPIVATDVGGNSEVVHNGLNGYIVPCSNQKVLAEKMLQLMRLPETTRKTMGDNGYRHLESNYDLNLTVKKWLNLYRANS